MAPSRVRRGRGFWDSAIREQGCSGLTQEEYCRQRGLCSTTLQRWRKRLGYTPGEVSSPAAAEPVAPPDVDFVRVVAEGAPSLSAPTGLPLAELHLPFGAVLRCTVGTDAVWLAQVIVACGRLAC